MREQAIRAYMTHGKTKTREYTIWLGMIARCENVSNPAYRHYGARGITICRRWRRSFVCFVEDMGLRPSVNHSLDRIDNDGNYEPSNCRWATDREQQRNRRNNVWIEAFDECRTLKEWSQHTGLGEGTLRNRFRNGWEVERALTTPTRTQRQNQDKDPGDVELLYRRRDDLIRLTLTGLTNHELREVLIGLWCRLDAEDRADHITALHHYSEDPDAYLSPVAAAIKEGEFGESSIDLKALADRGERIKP